MVVVCSSMKRVKDWDLLANTYLGFKDHQYKCATMSSNDHSSCPNSTKTLFSVIFFSGSIKRFVLRSYSHLINLILINVWEWLVTWEIPGRHTSEWFLAIFSMLKWALCWWLLARSCDTWVWPVEVRKVIIITLLDYVICAEPSGHLVASGHISFMWNWER